MKKYIYLFIASLFVSTIATSQIDRSKQPVPGPAPVVNLAEPQTFTLNNGLTVLVVQNNKLPAVRAQLLIDNPIHASGQKAGVENVFSSMMGNGTTTISKNDFNEEVDYLGASIFFGSESAYASSLSEYFPRIVELMAEAIKNPLLTQDEFETEKNKQIELLKSQEKNVSSISNRVRSALVFGKDHPKGEFTTIEKLEKLTLMDVKNFYDNFFNPKNAYLVVVGDVTTAEVEKLVKANFSDWKVKTVPSAIYSDPKDVQYTQINFVDMPNAVQSEIGVQNLVNLKMSDPDYFAVLVANRVLGGGFNSLLNMNLREAKGWTYGASSNVGADKDITRFIAATSVRNAVTDSAVVEILKEIRFMRDNKVTTQQLANAKAKFTGDFVLALERPATIANYALKIKTQNLANDFYINYLRKINAVTVEDVERVSKKYFKPDNLRIVVVGKGSEVLEGLGMLKGPKGRPIPISYFDADANPVAKPDYNQTIEAGVTAESVLSKYMQAKGGQKAMEAVNSVKLEATAEMQGMKLNLEMIKTKKNQSSMIISMGGAPLQKTVFDGETGYMVVQGQRIENDDTQNSAAKLEAIPFKELNAKNAKLERMEKVDGKDAYVLSFGNNSEAYYDKASGLKVKETSVQEAMGQTITATVEYDDYKEVDGIQFPFVIKQSAGPQEITFNVDKMTLNVDVSAADFE